MSNDTTFPMASIIRLMKSSGAERVSREAALAMDAKLTAIANSWTKKATALATHAKRATVKAEDIDLASSE